MGAWGFVFLAYGVVWFALLAYLVLIKRKIRETELEISALRSSGGGRRNA